MCFRSKKQVEKNKEAADQGERLYCNFTAIADVNELEISGSR